MITFVWAEDKKHQIGLDEHLPWHLPADLKHFHDLTINHPIVMGRKTFDSLPKILPKRQHIVLTRNSSTITQEQVITVSSFAELDNWLDEHRQQDISVIGGTSVFAALLNRVDCLEKTAIKATFAGDTIMPAIDYSQFDLVKGVSHYPDEQNKYSYDFLTYNRKE